MKVIRKFLQAKTGIVEDCEDAIVVTNNFVAVIDGVTSKSSVRINGKTLGKLSAEIVCGCVETLKRTASAKDLISAVTRAFNSVTAEVKLVNPLGVTLAVYSDYLHEVWFIGDVQGIINGIPINNKSKLDIVNSEARSAFIQARLKQGMSIDEMRNRDIGREFILPLLSIEGIFANCKDSEYGYTVLDGKTTPTVVIRSVTGNEVILATDGYPELKSSFGESEAILANILKHDPLLIDKFKATKGLQEGNVSFDDRAYVKFSIT